MKGVIGWAKANLIIVIVVAVALLALPTLLFFSARMNNKLRADVQTTVDADLRAIQQVSTRFVVPSLDPAKPAVEFTRPPNAPTIEALRERFTSLRAQSDSLLALAEKHNRRNRTLLLGGTVADTLAMIERGEKPAGLFPEPDPALETRLRQDVNGAWIAAHEEALRRVGAGKPRDPEVVLQQLQALWSREMSRFGEPGAATLTEEEQTEIRERLSAQRLSTYRDQATQLAFYADLSVFQGVARWEDRSLPALPLLWDWQHRLWIHEDIIDALALANVSPVTGAPAPLVGGPVKRVESILVRPWNLERAEPGQPVEAGISAEIPLDFNAALTGRQSWPLQTNPLYDVRYAEVILIVASDRMPRVIDAISAVSFMTVTDVDVEAVDAGSHLEQGYFYGPDHLVRARLLIETLWLRKWMSPLMPPSVRQTLGIPTGAGAESPAAIEEDFESPRGGRRGER